MNNAQNIWMGIGIFERLYSEERIKKYFVQLEKLPNQKYFILPDEITGCNNFVLLGKKFDRQKDAEVLKIHKAKAHDKFLPKYEFIRSLIGSHSSAPSQWSVAYWDFFSDSPEYAALLHNLYEATQRFENTYLKREILKVTIFGFGARLRKNFTNSFVDFVFDKNFYFYLETLAAYTIEEIAATLYLAKHKWVKAGHAEEKPFDELSIKCYERFKEEFFPETEPPEFYYIK